MATAKEIKEKVYFDKVYNVLEDIKMRLNLLREDLAKTYGKDSKMLLAHDRHLLEENGGGASTGRSRCLKRAHPLTGRPPKGTDEEVESDVSVRETDNRTGTGFFRRVCRRVMHE